MIVTYDDSVKAAYIYLLDDGIPPGDAAKQVIVGNQDIVLDFDKSGHLIGVEILNMARLHPKLKRIAITEEGDL